MLRRASRARVSDGVLARSGPISSRVHKNLCTLGYICTVNGRIERGQDWVNTRVIHSQAGVPPHPVHVGKKIEFES